MFRVDYRKQHLLIKLGLLKFGPQGPVSWMAELPPQYANNLQKKIQSQIS